MNNKKLLLNIIFGIPKTIVFNFICFDFRKAFRLPVFIGYNVKIKKIYKGCIEIKTNTIKPFSIMIGLGGSDAIPTRRGYIYLNKKQGGRLVFKGKARLSYGCILYCNSGTIEIGNNFRANSNLFISCDQKISFDDHTAIGWNVTIRDSDGHYVLLNGKKSSNKGKIKIGKHCWICSEVTILKNSYIGNDSIIAYNSCLTGNHEYKSNLLIGGYPAKEIKNNVNWIE